MDFQEQLKQQLAKFDSNSESTSNTDQPRHQPIRISKKRKFFGRILPIAPSDINAPFAVPFERVWLPYKTQAGAVSQVPVIINSDDPEDEIAKICNWLVMQNNKYRKEHQGYTDDIINIFDKKPVYGFHIERRAEILGVELDPQTGNMRTNANGVADVKNYLLPISAYTNILRLLVEPDMPYQINGHPFATPQQFITPAETFPLGIQFDGSTDYPTTPRPDIVLPAITYNYVEKNADGSYKYFDDPVKANEVTRTASPDFYELVLAQLKDRVRQATTNAKSQPQQPQQQPSQPQNSQPTSTAPAWNSTPVEPQVATPEPAKTEANASTPWTPAPEDETTVDPFEKKEPQGSTELPTTPSTESAQPQWNPSPDIENTDDEFNASSDVSDILHGLGLE